MSEFGRALAMALHKGPPRVAMCPVCPDEVLVMTFRWADSEFYCLACEGHFGFVDPRPAESTPELEARIEQTKVRFAESFPPEPHWCIVDGGQILRGPVSLARARQLLAILRPAYPQAELKVDTRQP